MRQSVESPLTRTILQEPECAHRLRAAIATAEPKLLSISDADSALHPAPGKWSPRQIVGHLIDSASNNHQRFVRAVWQEDMVFPPYAQEQWVKLQQYDVAPWPELITLWAAYNRHLARVMELIPAEARHRIRERHNLDTIAMRAPRSKAEATLDYFMRDYVNHLEMHLRQILGPTWSAE